MSNMASSSQTGRSASGAFSDNTIASSASSTSSPFDLPQRVATSGESGKIPAIRRHRARHTIPAVDLYSDDFDKDFQDWEFLWDFDDAVIGPLLEFIRVEYNLPILKDTPISEIGGGYFNKVFAFRTEEIKDQAGPNALPEILILRVGWPLAPKHKLESDVATMTFARREAGLPVPRCLWYESSGLNPWHMEWSIMEFVDAPSFDNVEALWNNPQCKAMKNLAEIINSYCESLTKCHNFDKIGSIYFVEHEWNTCGTMGVEGYVIGPSVEYQFWAGPRAYYVDLPRGPFNSVEEYISAQVELHIRDLNNKDIPDAAFSYNTSCRCPTKFSGPYTCPHVQEMRQNFFTLAETVQAQLIPAAVRKAELSARADGYTGPLGGCGAVMWHHDLHYANILLKSVATEPRYDPDFDGPGIAAILDWELVGVKPRFLHGPVPKVARSFSFLKEDRGEFPIGDQRQGVPLKEFFEGRAFHSTMCPEVFNPPAESTTGWGLALLNLVTMIAAMGEMEEDDIEWWFSALEYLGFPQDGKTLGRGDDDGKDDKGPGGGKKKDDDDSGGSFNGSKAAHWGGPPREKQKHNDDKGDEDPNLQRLNKFAGAFNRSRRAHAPRDCFRPRPFCPKEFLKLPIVPRDPASAKGDTRKTKVKKPMDLTLPPLTPAPEQTEMLSVPLTPGPRSPVHVQYHALNMTMQVPLQDLIRGIENNQQLYGPGPTHDVIPGTPQAQQVTQAPPIAPSSWVPAFLSTFLCCY